LQERTIVPVGGTEPIAVDVRVVAATHRDLSQMVREGSFRQDLYYRLNVVRLSIQPLRERSDDVLPLARQFLEEVAWTYEEPVKSLAPTAEEALLRHNWPGNVRELRNAIERAFLFCNDRTIDVAHLPDEIRGGTDRPFVADVERTSLSVPDAIPRLADAERLLIARALKATGGNQADAARMLDVERHRLRRMITGHGLEDLLRRRPR
jgi:transcriptional regulator with PAS, ATPase and Fis domain